MQKATEDFQKTADEFQKMGKDNYYAIARSYGELNKGFQAIVASVRRQSFWDSERDHLREALARLLGDVMRPADDAASVEWRWSVV